MKRRKALQYIGAALGGAVLSACTGREVGSDYDAGQDSAVREDASTPDAAPSIDAVVADATPDAGPNVDNLNCEIPTDDGEPVVYVNDTLEEGATSTYSIGSEQYEVTPVIIGEIGGIPTAKLMINDETSAQKQECETYVFSSGMRALFDIIDLGSGPVPDKVTFVLYKTFQ